MAKVLRMRCSNSSPWVHWRRCLCRKKKSLCTAFRTSGIMSSGINGNHRQWWLSVQISRNVAARISLNERMELVEGGPGRIVQVWTKVSTNLKKFIKSFYSSCYSDSTTIQSIFTLVRLCPNRIETWKGSRRELPLHPLSSWALIIIWFWIIVNAQICNVTERSFRHAASYRSKFVIVRGCSSADCHSTQVHGHGVSREQYAFHGYQRNWQTSCRSQKVVVRQEPTDCSRLHHELSLLDRVIRGHSLHGRWVKKSTSAAAQFVRNSGSAKSLGQPILYVAVRARDKYH